MNDCKANTSTSRRVGVLYGRESQRIEGFAIVLDLKPNGALLFGQRQREREVFPFAAMMKRIGDQFFDNNRKLYLKAWFKFVNG